MCNNNINENPVKFRSPREHDLLHDDLHITTKDGLNLFGWLIYKEKKSLLTRPTIVFFHENAGSKKIHY